MIRAAIDIGSNSTLFLVAEQKVSGNWHCVEEDLIPNGLGWELAADGGLTREVQDRNIDILTSLVTRAGDLGAVEIRAVGTAALRKAANADSFIERVFTDIGLDIRLISGQEEARLTYLGAMMDFRDHRGFSRVIDVGGGSSEVVLGDGSKILEAASLPMGAVSLTQSLIPTQPLTQEQSDRIQSAISEELALLSHKICGAEGLVIAVGGTASTLAALVLGIEISELGRCEPVTVSVTEVEEYWRRFAEMSVDDIATLPNMPADRAKIITGGTAILWGILTKLGVKDVILSGRGLRWGLMMVDDIQAMSYGVSTKEPVRKL